MDKLKRYTRHCILVQIAFLGVTSVFWRAQAQSLGGDLLVTSSQYPNPGSVKRYDRNTGAFLGDFVSGLNAPVNLKYDSSGRLYVIYHATPDGQSVSGVKRFDGGTGSFIDDFIPLGSGGLWAGRGMAFSPNGARIYIASFFTNSVKQYDATTGSYLGDFVTPQSGGLSGPIGIAFGPDGNLYVISVYTASVKRYNSTTGDYLGDFAVMPSGGYPQNLVFRPDGRLYVVTPGSGGSGGVVLRFDAATGAFIDTFVTGLGAPYDLVFGDDGNLYIDESGISPPYFTVARYSGSTGSLVDFFVAPGSGGLFAPGGMAFMPPAGPIYKTCLLYDPNKAVKSGATIPIKLQLCNNNGDNMSSRNIVLQATGTSQTSTSISGPVQDAGNANPDGNFRFDNLLGASGGYILNLKTTGLITGTYTLRFTVSADSMSYAVPFQVK